MFAYREYVQLVFRITFHVQQNVWTTKESITRIFEGPNYHMSGRCCVAPCDLLSWVRSVRLT